MVEVGNEFCKDNELDRSGFEVMEEFRVDRTMMLEFQKERKVIVDKLITKGQFFKRLLWG